MEKIDNQERIIKKDRRDSYTSCSRDESIFS